jgi:hypothetical protein
MPRSLLPLPQFVKLLTASCKLLENFGSRRLQDVSPNEFVESRPEALIVFFSIRDHTFTVDRFPLVSSALSSLLP